MLRRRASRVVRVTPVLAADVVSARQTESQATSSIRRTVNRHRHLTMVNVFGATHGTPVEKREVIRPGVRFMGLGARRVISPYIRNMAEVAAQRPEDPLPRARVENGIRASLAVPLGKDSRLLGIIT